MTLRKAAAGVVTVYGGTFRIGFNSGDDTEFSASNLKELEELWRDFCEENGFKKSSVDYIEAV